MIEKRKVTVILLPGEEGSYAVFIPLFPSCTTGGNTVQEALQNAKECLELALEKPTADDLEFLGYLDVDHVVVGRIEVEAPAQTPASKAQGRSMTHPTFDQVWQLLGQLEGDTILTPDFKEPNWIGSFGAKGMERMILRPGADKQHPQNEDWIKGSVVPRTTFKTWWDRLTRHDSAVWRPGWWRIAGACLVHVPELGVEVVMDGDRPMRPLKLRFKRSLIS